MKILKKRKGLTLTEVMVSVIILSVIVTAVLSYFPSAFANMFKQREQNIAAFEIQKSFEERLAKIKKDGGTGTDVETFTYTVNGSGLKSIDVTGTILDHHNNNVKGIKLFVSNQKESVLDIPKEEDLSVTVTDAKRYYYVGDTVPSGKVAIKDSYKSSVKMHTESGWFLSNREIIKREGGSNAVVVGTTAKSRNGVPETASKVVFPKMMDDFTQLSKTDSGFRINDRMRGKYLVFAGRAINSYGRVGAYQEAESRIWVMGIPVTDGLQVHTDVDLALQRNQDGTNAAVATTGLPVNDIFIRNYNDKNNPDSSYKGTVPVQSQYEDSLGQARQFIAFGGDGMYFANRNLESYTTSVLIGNMEQSGRLLTYQPYDEASKTDSGMLWSVDLSKDGRVSVGLSDSTGLNTPVVTDVGTIDYSKDHSFQVRSSKVSSGGRNYLRMELFIDGQSLYNRDIAYRGSVGGRDVSHPVTKTRIYYGGNTYINELAMYNRSLPDSEISSLTRYFNGKYDTSYNDR